MTSEQPEHDPQDGSTEQESAEQPANRRRGTGGGFGWGDGNRAIADRLVERVIDTAKAAREAADAGRPEVERLVREARSAAEGVIPYAERAAHEAAAFVSSHEPELKSAVARAARIAVRLVTPPALREAIDEELARERQAEREREAGDTVSPSHDRG